MDAERAKLLAEIIGGDVWDSGGGICLVLKHRTDGRIVAFSNEGVSVYLNEEAVQGSEPLVTIELCLAGMPRSCKKPQAGRCSYSDAAVSCVSPRSVAQMPSISFSVGSGGTAI